MRGPRGSHAHKTVTHTAEAFHQNIAAGSWCLRWRERGAEEGRVRQRDGGGGAQGEMDFLILLLL